MYSLLEKYAPKLHKYFEMRKKNAQKVTKSIKNDDFIVILTLKWEPIVCFFHLIKITISYNYEIFYLFFLVIRRIMLIFAADFHNSITK
jgi:hypothetical protein